MEKTVYTFRGLPATQSHPVQIWVDGTELSPKPSQAIYNHSPDGFEYGYLGSGPSQTALAICLHIFKNKHIASRIYQVFKQEFVAQWTIGKPFEQTVDLTNFICDHAIPFLEGLEVEKQQQELDNTVTASDVEELLNITPATTASSPVSQPVAFLPGDIVRINQFLQKGQEEGCLAIVYEKDSRNSISILTQQGVDLGGFDQAEQDRYLTFIRHANSFAYNFRSVFDLKEDFRRGRFNNYFLEGEH